MRPSISQTDRCLYMSVVTSVTLAVFLSVAASPNKLTIWRGESPPRIEVSRVVHLAVHEIKTRKDHKFLADSQGVLAITMGGEGELPEGPNALDVLDNGDLAVSDPLQDRLVLYDSLGKFRKAIPLGFAADQVTATATGALEVRKASTGALFVVDNEGHIRAVDAAASSGEATLTSGVARQVEIDHGIITGRSPGRKGALADTLHVRYSSKASFMIALQCLSTDEDGYTYVALVTTAGGESVRTRNIVRKYSPGGVTVCEIHDLSGEYFVAPVDPLRVRHGRVYQLAPLKNEVRVNMWDTAQTH
jgi:hypothetical protein